MSRSKLTVTDELVAVYLNGITTGVTSTCTRLGMSGEVADEFAYRMVEAVHADAAAMEQVREQIAETLAGEDSGVKTVTVRMNGADS